MTLKEMSVRLKIAESFIFRQLQLGGRNKEIILTRLGITEKEDIFE